MLGTLTFIRLAIHHPKPEHVGDVLASMHRVNQAVADDPFDEWCEQPAESFRLTQPQAGYGAGGRNSRDS